MNVIELDGDCPEGDSGAPVFSWSDDGDHVIMEGIVTGGRDDIEGQERCWISQMEWTTSLLEHEGADEVHVAGEVPKTNPWYWNNRDHHFVPVIGKMKRQDDGTFALGPCAPIPGAGSTERGLGGRCIGIIYS